MRILLIEDEPHMAQAVAQVLRRNQYTVDVVGDGDSGLDFAMAPVYDAVVMDIMLPGRDGISILKAMREEGVKTPVLLLTARSRVDDKITGLDSGADDYLAKPFEMEELMARLRALCRRSGQLETDYLLRFADLEYDPQALMLSTAHQAFRLTRKEGQLMELLLQNRSAISSPGAIIEKLWGYDSDTEDGHVQVYISFLRKKLHQLHARAEIKTVRGVGYVLEEKGEG
ncbi:MAG: response regulator transcription factor [Oscillospiraceae bacterium]|nr:response regulator transcription factor [Oscillospiraceae bacterium]